MFMNWEKIYLGCFSFGFLMSFAALVIHSGHAHFHSTGGGHGHGVGFKGGHSHGGSPGHGGGFSKINMTTLSAFLTWFGGVGYLLDRYSTLGFLIALAVAAISGIGAAWAVFLFVSKVLLRNEREMLAVDYEMVGMLGRVSCPVIGESGTGEMIYSHDGARRHVAIRSEQSVPIVKGTEVVVTRYERGVAYVRRWDELSGL
jgi:membrane protein implicated in regulation of membrane protease activity